MKIQVSTDAAQHGVFKVLSGEVLAKEPDSLFTKDGIRLDFEWREERWAPDRHTYGATSRQILSRILHHGEVVFDEADGLDLDVRAVGRVIADIRVERMRLAEKEVSRLNEALSVALNTRNWHIRMAHAEGMSMYSIASIVDKSESAVKKVVDGPMPYTPGTLQ